MGDVLAVLADITPLVFGWLVFAAWTTVQIKWYRRSSARAPESGQGGRKRKNGRRSAAPVATQVATPEHGRPEMFSSFGASSSEGATRYGVPMSHGQTGPTVIS
jgi:hypothetical protein